MRAATGLMIAAALIATPALAQNTVGEGNVSAVDPAAPVNTDIALPADPASNATERGAVLPVTGGETTSDPLAADTDDDDDEDGRFPWGLLGLLGLAGLLGRRRGDSDRSAG